MRLFIQAIAVLIVISISYPVFAASGGWTIGGNVGITNAEQKDMDSTIEAGGTNASDIGNGLEVGGSFGYSWGDTSFIFRPSYYWVSEDGDNSEYSMSAITLMPFLRWNLLSNNTISFYTQIGLGWILMSGEIKEGTDSVEFSGNEIGYAAGLGAEFCFFGDHCFYAEGNLRIAGVNRMTVDSASGDLAGSNSAITQSTKSKELEIGGRDFAASLSGIHGLIGYNYHF